MRRVLLNRERAIATISASSKINLLSFFLNIRIDPLDQFSQGHALHHDREDNDDMGS